MRVLSFKSGPTLRDCDIAYVDIHRWLILVIPHNQELESVGS